MKTVAFIIPESHWQNYAERHPDYIARAKELDEQIAQFELRFKKRLKKVRFIDKAKEIAWGLKALKKRCLKMVHLLHRFR